jgi:hypothetical protein
VSPFEPPAGRPLKVLLIAGAGRSGSTLLEMLLGQVGGVVAIGELRFIWERGFVEDRLCGCGQPFSRCPFWTTIVAEAFGSPPRVDPRHMLEHQRLGTRIRQLPRVVTGTDRRMLDRMRLYRDAMEALYRTIRDRTGATLVVDSSKLPTYAHVVGTLGGVDMYVLHMVRDPRAAAHSWMRTRELPDRPGTMMQRLPPAKSAALWTLWNWTTERLWRSDPSRYLRIRYEDLVAEPERVVRAIMTFVGERPDNLPFVSNHSVELAATHSVAGNPSRFRIGLVDIRADEEWRFVLGAGARRIVETIAGPMMRRYGYRRLD